ncbi:hypothetical protein BKA70DRAFT_1226017 [Coprinopsis sp. MPI-PUGE-AT-0042]|nr:hypothetical protein BKA70DRAFT_1226017 [Coprinopsis sp. MPI-PUGE-AT-0042]
MAKMLSNSTRGKVWQLKNVRVEGRGARFDCVETANNSVKEGSLQEDEIEDKVTEDHRLIWSTKLTQRPLRTRITWTGSLKHITFAELINAATAAPKLFQGDDSSDPDRSLRRIRFLQDIQGVPLLPRIETLHVVRENALIATAKHVHPSILHPHGMIDLNKKYARGFVGDTHVLIPDEGRVEKLVFPLSDDMCALPLPSQNFVLDTPPRWRETVRSRHRSTLWNADVDFIMREPEHGNEMSEGSPAYEFRMNDLRNW